MKKYLCFELLKKLIKPFRMQLATYSSHPTGRGTVVLSLRCLTTVAALQVYYCLLVLNLYKTCTRLIRRTSIPLLANSFIYLEEKSVV